MAAELAFASSEMTTPFPCAIFLAYNICAGLTGLKSGFPGVSSSAFLGACSLRNFRQRRLVTRRGLDALLPGETVGKALHRRRRRKRPVAVADRGAQQGWPAGGAAFLELADDALGNIAHCVYRTDHLLLADNDIVEQAFKLRRHPRIDQGRVGLFENTEQRQASLGRHDVLSLGNRETR
jgi:hypothetical protein